jgi:hypothetical protein
MARVCMIRSRRFPPLAPIRRHHGAETVGWPVGRKALVYWFAVVLWSVHVVVMIPHIPHIRTLGTASATVTPIRTTDQPRRPGLAMIAASIGILYGIAILTVTQVAAFAAPPWSDVAIAVLASAVVLPLTAAIVDERRKGREDCDGLRRPRSMAMWCSELAGLEGNGYVLTDLVAARDGTGAGTLLIEVLRGEWARDGALVALYAATDDLVVYYTRLGAKRPSVKDRRMYFDLRKGSGPSVTAADS